MNIYRQIFQLHADLLKALSHPKRLEVVHLLRDQSLCVSDIQEMLGLSQANLSQHLQVLRDAKILETERDGHKIFYKISDLKVVKACDLLRQVLVDQYDRSNLGQKLKISTSEMLPLVKDPICGMRLSLKTASYVLSKGEEKYYFCAEGCLEKFKHQY